MRYISAPWRAEYVRNALKMKGCVFCEAVKGGDDPAAAVLFRAGGTSSSSTATLHARPSHDRPEPAHRRLRRGPADERPSWPSSCGPPSASCGRLRPHGFNAG